MSSLVYLGLGSNLGDRPAALEEALRLLEARDVRLVRRSSTWETAPVGGPPQGAFLNAVVAGRTDRTPEELLEACLETEREMGRVRREKNGPRVIDVDILLFGDLIREGVGLVVPHPRLHERRFVLTPLDEIAPDLRHPVLGRTVAELLEHCPDGSEVRLFSEVKATA